jgi:aminopeptidase N
MFPILRARTGERAYFVGLDAFMKKAGDFVSTEQLQAALEKSSERDLGDFFDFWVYGGHIPKLHLEWEAHDDSTVSAVIHSDVPFGTFKVPVVLNYKGAPLDEIWVVVRDGEGRLPKTAVTGKANVLLDPGFKTLAVGRKVTKRQ